MNSGISGQKIKTKKQTKYLATGLLAKLKHCVPIMILNHIYLSIYLIYVHACIYGYIYICMCVWVSVCILRMYAYTIFLCKQDQNYTQVFCSTITKIYD